MQTFLALVVVILLLAGGFAYVRDPEDCHKIGHDVVEVCKSVAPGHVNADKETPPETSPAPSLASAAAPAPQAIVAAPVPTPLPTDALEAWKAPATLPQQANWTWTTTNGKTYQGVRIVKVEADSVTILDTDGGARVSISTLPPALQKQLNYDPKAAQQAAAIRQQHDQQSATERAQEDSQARAPAPTVQQVVGMASSDSSKVKSLVGASLISADGHEWNFPTRGPGVEYLAIYFSAHWCPPCRAFTPQLVAWYNGFKPKHPNFELVFVSDDHDEAGMTEYMTTMAMPWPAVAYGERNLSRLNKFANTGIPDLVLVDSSGKVLSDSFDGSTYLGPEHVLDDIQKQLGN
jgi:thiol-disulfide isomerase/thioredoxin/predicted secreted protein